MLLPDHHLFNKNIFVLTVLNKICMNSVVNSLDMSQVKFEDSKLLEAWMC